MQISRNFKFIFMLIATTFTENLAQDVALISGDNNLYCAVAGGDLQSALMIINKHGTSANAEFSPDTSPYKINCKIQTGDQCNRNYVNKYWHLAKSQDYNFGFVFDRRWEDFTSDSGRTYIKGETYDTKKILSFTNNLIELPISVRATSDLHVFFCDSQLYYDCYWFIIDGWSGKKSGIRKCSIVYYYNNIPTKHGYYPQGECKKLQADSSRSYILSRDEWKHLLFKKNDGLLSVYLANEKEPLLEFKDRDKLHVNTVFVSLRSAGEYKVQQYDFLYTDTKKVVPMGNLVKYLNEDTFCMSMFINMCNHCKLNFTLYGDTSIDYKLIEMKSEGWEAHSFIVDIKHYKGLEKILYVETISAEKYGNFWAIDDIRSCTKNDIRFVKAYGYDKNSKCSILKTNGTPSDYTTYDLRFNNNVESVAEKDKCTNVSDIKIGKQCYPYDHSKYNLQEICYFDQANIKCSCLPGHYGNKCLRCANNTYGYDCEEKCGKCKNKLCNNVNGICASGCESNAMGDNCKTFDNPILSNPPIILNISYKSVEVQIQNDTYIGIKEPEKYKFQYKAIDDEGWLDDEQEENLYDWKDFSVKVVEGLNASVSYKVRVVLVTKDNLSETSDVIEESPQFTTLCKDIIEDNVKLSNDDITNTSATFRLEVSDINCPIQTYNFSLKGKKLVPLYENNGVISAEDLMPFEPYTLSFTTLKGVDVNIPFETKEGIPEEIEALKLINYTATSIMVTWEKPKRLNGLLKRYNVYYQHVRYRTCSENTTDTKKVIDSQEPNINIGDLRAYSIYIIGVSAFTIAEGPIIEAQFETGETDTPLDEELPDVKKVTITPENALEMEHKVDCTKRKGQYIYLVDLWCEDPWCDSKHDFKEYSKAPLHIPNLLPYSNYSLKLKLKRLHGKTKKNALAMSFKTNPSVPPPVSELKVFSKGFDFISLKWKPPSPPNGILENYTITISWSPTIASYAPLRYHVKPETCKIWDDRHCFSRTKDLQQFTQSQFYIFVQANNQNVTDLSTAISVRVYLAPEDPEVPLNPEGYFTEENVLKLKWQHPDKINGILQSFYIQIGSLPPGKYEGPFDQLNFTQSVNIEPTLIPYEKIMRVFLWAENTARKISKKVYTDVYCPPETPQFGGEQPSINATFNNSILIKIPPPQNLADISFMFVMVSSANEDDMEYSSLYKEMKTKCNILNNQLTWIAYGRKLSKNNAHELFLELGNESATVQDGEEDLLGLKISNDNLEPGMKYNICIIIMNEYMNMRRLNISHIQTFTNGISNSIIDPADEKSNPLIYGLILLVLLIPLIAWIISRKKHGKKMVPSMFQLNQAENNTPDVIPLTSSKSETGVSVEPKIQIAKPKLAKPGGVDDLKKFSKPIKLSDFEEYVKDALRTGELERQHALFPRGQTKPWTYGVEKPNKFKNRYNNLIAYDHSRVVLEKINGDDYSDYINANYVEGYNNPKAYIATQGPKITTVNDFWRMIWQENVKYIVMLANVMEGGKKKSEQYWPNINESLQFGNISVTFISAQLYADYEFRTFSVTHDNEERKVQQLHFTSWPDHGVPLYSQSLVPFLQKMLTIPQGKSPIVVHCSAGVGRTGTVILCDLCLRMAAREKVVDILWHQYNLREQRPNMVDNVEQYKLVHMVLLDCLFAPKTSVPCDVNFKNNVEKICATDIQNQLDYLEKSMWQDQIMRLMMENSNDISNFPEKNRFHDIAPDGYGRIFISRYPQNDESSSYINAVNVDGFRSPNRYIVTQQPLPATVGDFWRLVYEKDATLIVSLNEIEPSDESCCTFWPNESSPVLKPVPYITLEHSHDVKSEIYDTITIHLYHEENNQKSERRTIQLILFKNWPYSSPIPNRIEIFLTLLEETQRLSRAGGQVVVTCYDGARASGLFTGAAFVLEKIKLEQECDVCLAVRVIRHNRKQFVTSKEQLTYLYQLAVKYIGEFETYSNFVTNRNQVQV